MTRTALQSWMRESFRALLQGDRDEVDALVAAITPHSWRAGLASDMEAEGAPRENIMRVGRWYSHRAVEKYIRDTLAQRLRRFGYRPIRGAGAVANARAAKAVPVRDEDSSEGYDVSSDSSGSDVGEGDDGARARRGGRRTRRPTPGHHAL